MSLSERERQFFTNQGRSRDAADIIAKERLESALVRVLAAVDRWADSDGHICITGDEREELANDLRKAIRGKSS